MASRAAAGTPTAGVSVSEADLIGPSASTRALDALISTIARTDAKVLITGESGAGKEVVARQIHRRSPRSRMPFVTINCAGIPESLLESELFGHVRGSFTGADRDRAGSFETANGGTLFLDEIGEMSLRMQALLLRFLETGEIQRVGADRHQTRVDVRLLAATNRDLPARIKEGMFRLDLFYRLDVVHVHMPPLRERKDDIPELLVAMLNAYAHKKGGSPLVPTPEAIAVLQRYHWPGNVRELRNLAERLVVRLADGATIRVEDLPEDMLRRPIETAPGEQPRVSRAAQAALDRMRKDGESFWVVVHAPFMARDLTRADIRAIVSEGLEMTRGSYKHVVELFNMSARDYKPFLSFLRKHDCHMPFQGFRTLGVARTAGSQGAAVSRSQPVSA